MLSLTSIAFSIVFGIIGFGYIKYGTKNKKGIALLSGFLLCVLPYAISNVIVLIVLSLVCIVTPFYFRY